jgi:predicted lipid-binding transport protein (Tim44 family)
MSQYFDVTNLVFLVLAIAIFLRLRSVLGRKTGHEQPPFDPIDRTVDQKPRPAETAARTADNVIPMPSRTAPVEPAADLAKIAPPGSALDAALKQILSVDRTFDARGFLDGARQAYEMIVTAFAEGDRETLKMLLAPDVFNGFEGAISAREKAGQTMQSTFVGIDKADITEATLRGTTAQITIRFVSQLITVTRDKGGDVVDGDPAKVVEVIDVWTFARNTASRDPNWSLVATEAGD